MLITNENKRYFSIETAKQLNHRSNFNFLRQTINREIGEYWNKWDKYPKTERLIVLAFRPNITKLSGLLSSKRRGQSRTEGVNRTLNANNWWNEWWKWAIIVDLFKCVITSLSNTLFILLLKLYGKLLIDYFNYHDCFIWMIVQG